MANYPTSKDTQASLYKATNRARTTITAGISPTDLTVNLTDGSAFPDDNFLLSVNEEIMLVDTRAGNVCTIAERGFESTLAATHVVDSVATCALTALQRNNLRDGLIDVQGYLWNYRGTVVSSTETDPSTLTPADDSQYIVAEGAVGVWTGEDQNLAIWDGVAWQFTAPENGFEVYDETLERVLRFDEPFGGWRAETGSITSPYDPTRPYPQGALVVHNFKLYEALVDAPAGGAFDPTQWQAVHRTPTVEAYSPATAYYAGDAVSHKSSFWVCTGAGEVIGVEPGTDAAVWYRALGARDWAAGDQFVAGEIVVHDRRFWTCLQDATVTNPEPGTNAAYWYAVAPYDTRYSTSAAYKPGDFVAYGGRIFLCIVDTPPPAPAPGTDPAVWVAADVWPVWDAQTIYTEGEVVLQGLTLYRWNSATPSTGTDVPGVSASWEQIASDLGELHNVDVTNADHGMTLKRDSNATAPVEWTPKLPVEDRVVGTEYFPGELILDPATDRLYRVQLQHAADADIAVDIASGALSVVSKQDFPDNEFEIFDNQRPASRARFNANNIALTSEREVRFADRDVYLGTVPNDYTGGAHYAIGDICLQSEVMYRAIADIPSAPATFDPAQWRQIPVGGGDTNVHVDQRYQADMRKAFPNPYRDLVPVVTHRVFVSGATSPIECVGMYEQVDDVNGRVCYEKTQSGTLFRLSYSAGAWQLRDVSNGTLLFTGPNADRPGYVAEGAWTAAGGSGILAVQEFFPPYFTGGQAVAERNVANSYDAAQPWLTIAELPHSGAYRVNVAFGQASRHPTLTFDVATSWGSATLAVTSAYYSSSALDAVRVMSNSSAGLSLLQIRFTSSVDNISSSINVEVAGATSKSASYVRFDTLPRTGDTISGYTEWSRLSSMNARRGFFSDNVTCGNLFTSGRVMAEQDVLARGNFLPRVIFADKTGQDHNLQTDSHTIVFQQSLASFGLSGNRKILVQFYPVFIAGTSPENAIACAWIALDRNYSGLTSVVPLKGRETIDSSRIGCAPCGWVVTKNSSGTITIDIRVQDAVSITYKGDGVVVLTDLGPA